MINQAICPEPSLWFSERRPCFIQNYMVNSMNLESAIIYLHQGSGAQKQVLSYLSQNYLSSHKSRTNVKCTTCIWWAQHVEIVFYQQWCNQTLARWFWATRMCLRASKNSKICLFGYQAGCATSWKANFENYSRYSLIKWYQFLSV